MKKIAVLLAAVAATFASCQKPVLDEVTIEEGYNSTVLTFAGSEEVTYVKYEIFRVEDGQVLPNTNWTTGEPIEFPTEDNYIDAVTYEAEYDAEAGFQILVDNDYGVEPDAVKLYYTFMNTRYWDANQISSAVVSVVDGSSGWEFVDLTDATQVVDGQVSFNFPVGTMNKYGAAKVGVHVVAVDANGKVSQYVTSELSVDKWVEPTE